MRIGGHTATHPILARPWPQAAREEIVGGKRTLESLVDAPVTLFAYPNGKPGEDFGDEHVAMAREPDSAPR
ncbi:MAG: polysaccharide deacetylase family protein [Comamonadaceae bacterium]|nr:polysaccharide deacetylase family protein [Comamonadaceae bacterium]